MQKSVCGVTYSGSLRESSEHYRGTDPNHDFKGLDADRFTLLLQTLTGIALPMVESLNLSGNLLSKASIALIITCGGYDIVLSCRYLYAHSHRCNAFATSSSITTVCTLL